VTGRIRDIGQNDLQSAFVTGSGGSSSYCHILLLIAFLEETFIRNTIIILGINNTTNNNYGRHQDLILLFKIPTGMCPQKGSPALP